MKTGLFDIEADGLRPTRVHCMTIIDANTSEEFRYTPANINEGVRHLETFDRTVAHNGIGYDYKVLRKLHGFSLPDEKCYDSLVLSRVFCGHLKEVDLDFYMRNKEKPGCIPGKLIGRHGIEAWGWRLGLHKGDYSAEMKAKGLDPWESYNEEMDEYCANDTRVLKLLWQKILSPHIGARQQSFRAVVNFYSKKLERDCNVTVNIDLPPDAYTRERFDIGEEMFSKARNSGAIDPLILKSLYRVSYRGLPGFLNAVGHDPKPQAIAANRRVVATIDRPEVAGNAQAAYISNFSTSVYPKTINIYHRTIDDPDGALFKQAMKSITCAPTIKTTPQEVVDLEHYLAWRMEDVKTSGILFNVKEGNKLRNELVILKEGIERKLRALFPPHVITKEIKRSAAVDRMELAMGSVAQALRDAARPRSVNKYVYFKVGSRKHVGQRLLDAGWTPDPEDRTPTGLVKVSDDVLGKAVKYFEGRGETEMAEAVEDIRTYYLIQKRIGQLATGEQAWLKLADRNGFIHPTITPCAAVTARATHSNPNVSQVPAILKVKENGKEVVAWGRKGEWGADCRKLFIVPRGFKQVGSDLSGIELRMLAHYLYPYDNGKFAEILLTKDVHEENRKIIGFANRTDAKRFIFALLYGAGDEKLGSIILPSGSSEQKKAIGRQFRAKCASGITGFGDLVTEVKREAQSGKIKAIDGRILPIRAEHAALNTLLQSGGAIVSKVWIEKVLGEMNRLGYLYGYDHDYTFLLWSHDEIQFAVRENYADIVADICVGQAAAAGRHLGCAIPIGAESKVGDNWFDCH